MKSLRIEEPCHEDWSKMTPTDRGAFCSKCEIDVYNFNAMNLQQIKMTLKENVGNHVCGRFDENQLTALNQDFLNWQKTNHKNFQSRFIYALLLVFGLSLFSCSTKDESKVIELTASKFQNYIDLSPSTQKIINYLFWQQDAIIAHDMIANLKSMEQYIVPDSVDAECTTVISADSNRQTQIEPPQFMGKMIAGGLTYDKDYMNYIQETTTIDTTNNIDTP